MVIFFSRGYHLVPRDAHRLSLRQPNRFCFLSWPHLCPSHHSSDGEFDAKPQFVAPSYFLPPLSLVMLKCLDIKIKYAFFSLIKSNFALCIDIKRFDTFRNFVFFRLCLHLISLFLCFRDSFTHLDKDLVSSDAVR